MTNVLHPLRRRLSQINLTQHEDKILLLLALVISAVVGLVIVGFLAFTEHLSAVLLKADPAKRFLSPLVGSLAGGWLLFKFFPEARGSGIPQTRVALLLQGGYISLRTVVGKFLCSAISLGSGVSLGREGPSVHIGAGIASAAGRRLGLSQAQVRSLIPVGTAAAVAAAFNTPLAAVLFTLEEILDDLHAPVVGSVVIGAATSWIILRLLLGDEPLFHVPAYHLVHPVEFLFYALLGLLGGLVSTVFVKLLLWQRAIFLKVSRVWKPFTPALGGLLVGLLALAVPGVLGVGYNLVSLALNGQLALKMMLLLLVLKIVTTSNCYGTGNAGGIFGPALFIGAMLGGSVGEVAHLLFPYHTANAGAYALVGMGAAFAGIVRTPMTSVIMIFEVTRDYTIIVPLMLSNMVSYVLSQRLQRLPIYEALSGQDGIIMPSAAHHPEPLTVASAMRTVPAKEHTALADELPRVYPDESLDAALQEMGKAGVNEIEVVTRAGIWPVGALSYDDALNAYKNQSRSGEKLSESAAQNWLPVITAITLGAVIIVSGLAFWERSRRSDFADQALQNGQKLLREGQADEAIAALRGGLAARPQDVKMREALGFALLQAGQYREASSYLSAASKAQPSSGPVLLALAEISLQEKNTQRALQLFQQSSAAEWPPGTETGRWKMQLDYASLLAETGKKHEAVAILDAAIEERGDDSTIGKQAALKVKEIGSRQQTEEAYAALAARFPADAEVWIALGDTRFEEDKLQPALDAYRSALRAAPEDANAKRAVARVQEIQALDPMQPGLSFRGRANRWQEILRRLASGDEGCVSKDQLAVAAKLLKKPAQNLDQLDQEMETAQKLWRGGESACRKDETLAHIMAKLPSSETH